MNTVNKFDVIRMRALADVIEQKLLTKLDDQIQRKVDAVKPQMIEVDPSAMATAFREGMLAVAEAVHAMRESMETMARLIADQKAPVAEVTVMPAEPPPTKKTIEFILDPQTGIPLGAEITTTPTKKK